MKHYLESIADVKSVYESAYELKKKRNVMAPRETFIEFMPPPKDSIRTEVYDGKSFPVGIKTSHSFSFKINRQRVSFLGTGVNAKVLTGIGVKANMVPGKSGEHKQFYVKLGGKAAIMAEVEPLALVPSSPDLRYDVTSVNGWRTSYRKDEPEKAEPSKVLPKLSRKRAAFEAVRSKFKSEGKRLKTAEDIKYLCTKAYTKNANHQKAVYASEKAERKSLCCTE